LRLTDLSGKFGIDWITDRFTNAYLKYLAAASYERKSNPSGFPTQGANLSPKLDDFLLQQKVLISNSLAGGIDYFPLRVKLFRYEKLNPEYDI
jgi:hypothetical protein